MAVNIEIKIGNELVGGAIIVNIATSEGGAVGDYTFYASSQGCEELGFKAHTGFGLISEHDRRQTVWALIQKVANQMMDSYKENK